MVFINSVHIVVDGLFDTVPVVLAFMVLGFGGGEQVGFVISAGNFTGMLLAMSTVFLSSHFGIAAAMGFPVLGYALGFLANAFAGSVAYAGLFFIISMAGHALFHNLAFSFISAGTERQRLGPVMSDFTAYGDVGRIPFTSAAAFIAAATLFGVSGWRVVCLVYGALALCIGCGIMVFALRGGIGSGSKKPAKKRYFPSLTLLRCRNVSLAMAASGCNTFSSDLIFVFLPLLLFAKGIDPKIFGAFAFGFTLGCFIGKMAGGRLLVRFGNCRVFVVAQLLTAVMLVVLVLVQDLALVTVAALLLGIVTKGTVPVVQTIITEPVADKSRYDDIFSINSMVRGVVLALTPMSFGLIADAFGIETVYLAMAVGAVVAVVPVILMDRQIATGASV